jgi:hypothetical protein
MQMEDETRREESCPNTGRRGVKVDAARTLTKSSTGEWNHQYSMGEEEVECGPQKDLELVTTTEAGVCFLEGGESEVSMTLVKPGHPLCSYCLGGAPTQLPPW